MKKTLYVLEFRMRTGKKLLPNKTLNPIGVFSSPAIAEKWIIENTKSWQLKEKKETLKKMFWALLECNIDDGDSLCLHGFYDLNGKPLKEE